jgi:lipopolysaccharide/colanic/teichoic acid biosynthesis glycosyltransferase
MVIINSSGIDRTVVLHCIEPTVQGRAACSRHFAKWSGILFERVCGALLLVLLAPALGLAALLVRLTSKGPALYKQVRQGKQGKEFTIFKFRTMYHDCETRTGACWSVPGDSRITRIGRLFRDFHVDELPQLWNVVRGDMRFLGPRPERPEIAAGLIESISRYEERLQVAPGLTGLAQILLPPDFNLQSVRRKLAYDLYLLENASFALHFKILICTVLHIVGVPFDTLRNLLTVPTLEHLGLPAWIRPESPTRFDASASTEVLPCSRYLSPKGINSKAQGKRSATLGMITT